MRTVHALPVLFALTVALCLPLCASAQVPDPVVAAEAPRPGAGHHYIGMGAETVNPADGSLSFDLPLQPPAGRGLSWRFGIRYSGGEQFFLSNWSTKDNELWWWPNGYFGSGPLQVGGWSYDVPSLTATTSIFWQAYIPTNCYRGTCQFNLNQCYGNDSYIFHGLDGNLYSLPLGDVFPDPNNTQQGFCNYGTNNQKSPANNHGILSSYQSSSLTNVVDPSGTTYQFQTGNAQPMEPTNPVTWGYTAESITDRNGNQLTVTANGYKDSTGRTAISWTGIGNTGDQITVSGLSSPVTLKWTTTPVTFPETGYNLDSAPSTCTLAGSFTNSISVLSEIDLPNGQKYTFQYDGTYGRVSKITFPDGGYVRYLWGLYRSAKSTHSTWVAPGVTGLCDFVFDIPAITDRFVSFDGSTEVLHQQFSYAATTWSNNSSWLTKQTTVTSTDLLTSQVTKTIYNYSPATTDNNVWVTNALYSLQAPVETNVLYQDGSGKTFKEVNKTWLSPHVMLAEQTILYDASGNRNAGSGTVRCYDANEQATNLYEYGFQTEGSYPGDQSCYSSATKVGSLNNSYLGPLRRQTTTAYHTFFTWNGGIPPTWSGTHIVNAPDSVTVADGTGATAKQALFSYDENTLQSSGAINLTNPGATRANITTQQNLISGSTYAKTTYTYFDTGQVCQKTDSCGNTTCADMTGSNHTATYSYADSYASGTGTPPGQTNAYITQVTYPNTGVAHVEHFTWGYNDALIRSHTDQNGQTTFFTYNTPPSGCSFPDGLNRLSSVTYPDGGNSTFCYNDAPYNPSTPSPSFTATKLMATSPTVTNLTALTAFDGLGHTVRSVLTSDPDCASGDRSDTTYDGFGRSHTVSNPYCSTSDPTYGLTTYAYDAIGRATQVAHPDGNTVLTTYSGPATQVQDEGNGAQRTTRISQVDGLGRLTSVCEVAPGPFVGAGGSSSASLIGSAGSPAACGQTIAGTGFLTTYQYDTLDNLLQVNQSGIAARTFSYDSLSRLLTAFNPESGSTSYSYDANGNLSTKTDARNITTTYSYDALNRLAQKTYNDTPQTPTVTFAYDQGSCSGYGITCNNLVGRLFKNAVGSNTYTVNSYDPMGRIAYQVQGIPNANNSSYAYGLPYTYDLMGNMTFGGTGQYGGTGGFTYAYNTAARLTGHAMGAYNTYTTDLSGVHYDAAGRITSDTLGNGETESWTYNNRGFSVSSTSTLNGTNTYSYNITSFAPNGDVLAASDSVNGNWTYSYDPFNRLVGSNKNSGQAVYSYVYDRFGNRWQQNGPNSMQLTFTGNNPSSPQNNNRMDGYSYDAAGNLLNDGTHQYFYDAENHLVQVDGTLPYCSSNGASGTAATACYFYDADGHRVRNTGVADCAGHSGLAGGMGYTYDLSGRWVTAVATDAANEGPCEYEVYAGNRHLFHSKSLNLYSHTDWLGTERARICAPSSSCGGYNQDLCTSLPFGDGLTCTFALNGTYVSHDHFTGKERDTETGLDNFGARFDASSFGRFMTPDSPSYSNHKNPQSWNLYAYGLNNPVTLRDADGHEVVCANNPQQCQKDAAAATANAEAAKRVTTNTVTTKHSFLGIHWTTSKTTIAISGDINSFRSLSTNAAKLADLVTTNKTVTVSYADNNRPLLTSWDTASSLHGGSGSDPRIGAAVIDPTRTEGAIYDRDAIDNNVPQSNTAEEFAHEVLGHIWGDWFGGAAMGTKGNLRDSIASENAVRALDPTRGQKELTSHHDYREAPDPKGPDN